MAPDANEALSTKWQDRLKRQSDSGLTIGAFCRNEGISEGVFYAWKRKLRGSFSARTVSGKAKPTQRSGKSRTAGPRRRRLRTVPFVDSVGAQPQDFLQLPVRSAQSSPWIELSLVDGTVVRIPQENMAALTTLLRTLRAENGNGLDGEVRHA